eukprot:1338172-Prymnesium_polylepis.3
MFVTPVDWEMTATTLLGHWGASVQQRINEHERLANTAGMLEAIRLPLLLFALIMSAISLTITPESRATAFGMLGVAQVRHTLATVLLLGLITRLLAIARVWQVIYMILDPSGWRERHMTFAERYAELFSEISDALDKPKGSRRRKGGPPISPL